MIHYYRFFNNPFSRKEKAMKKWEYRFDGCFHKDQFLAILNGLGHGNWECIGYNVTKPTGEAYPYYEGLFKREIPEPKPVRPSFENC